MFKSKLIPVWVGILFLAGMLFMGNEACPPQHCAEDLDGDGYGDPATVTCPNPDLDCDDSTPHIYPDARELCDGVDNQCPGDTGHGEIDEGCAPMALIPAGCFDMGDHFGEGTPDELPVHNICISAFHMGVHEVTNARYAECVDAGQCSAPVHSSSATRDSYFGEPAYDDYPVIYVSWFDAAEYCAWVGQRLPTEAEWEYAARGGLEGKRYPWGDDIIGSDANYWSSGDTDGNDTRPVGSYSANGYGLFDMAGNAWEWVSDWHQYYYSTSPSQDPPGPSIGEYRTLRGGSWGHNPVFLRMADRGQFGPLLRLSMFGFRCTR